MHLIQSAPFIDVARTHNIPTSIDEPTATVTTGRNLSIVQPDPFLSSYYGNGGESLVSDPSPTIRTKQGHALIEPDISELVEACGYRMLRPHEAMWLMSFRKDYILLGNQEERFKQAGNAVTPPVAEMLGRAVAIALK
jgi:DNA (cytosine-5)-methyltransferase 1